VSVDGVEMSWIRVPPSDQDTKLYVVPPTTWGEGAPIVRVKLTTPRTLCGEVNG